MRRRALVVTDESARHPFRASLPPFLRGQAVTLRQPGRFAATAQSTKEFLMAYCACFLAVGAFMY